MSEIDLPSIVIKRPDLTLLDTRALEWIEPPPGEMFHGTGAKFRALSRHPDGWVRVYQVYVPPGTKGIGHGGKPDRHYHRTVHEWGYVLFGELALIEYDGLDDLVGQTVVYREGFFFDRSPGSVFGLHPELVSPTGVMIIEWRTGPGSSAQEAGSEHETVSIPL